MDPRCRNHRSNGEVLPLLASPADAAEAIRLTAPPEEGAAHVVLLCDAEHRLVVAVVVPSGSPSALDHCADLVAEVADPVGVSSVVVGVVRRRHSPVGPRQVAALVRLAQRCREVGVDLVDVIAVWPRGWQSVWHLAAGPGDRDHGPQ